MMKIIFKNILLLSLLISVLFFYSCEESLPEYKEPENVLKSTIAIPADQSTVNLFVREDFSVYPPRVTFLGAKSLLVRFQVKNMYDEVIEDSSFVGGYVRIQDINDENNFVVQNIKYTDVQPFPGKLGEIIRIRPNEQFNVDVECKFLNEDGLYLWSNKEYVENPVGTNNYAPINLKVKAYLRLYKKLGMIISNEITIKLKVISNVYYPG